MRRRPIILLLCATAALVGAAIALADAPATSPAVKALGESPDAQVGPSIAVNPAGGSPSVAAVAFGTDWRGGSGNPQSSYTTGSVATATGVTSWSPTDPIFPHSGGEVGGGSPDVAWGPGNKVYAIELARDPAAPGSTCSTVAGVYFSASSNGGATWGTPIEVVADKSTVGATEASIAYSPVTGRIYIAYTYTDPCGGGPGSTSKVSLIAMPNDQGTGVPPTIPVSGSGLRFEHPSVAVLPNGRIGVAYYDASQSPGSVLVTTCDPSTGVVTSVPVCDRDSPWPVDSSANPAGNAILGLTDVDVRPRIAADPTGRVIVTWAKQTPASNMDVFTATSRDAGATFGQPQPVPADPGGTANQIDPTVAIAAGGRADVAFLDTRWDGNAFRVAVSSSNTPSGLGTSESWTTSVFVESSPIVPVRPTVPGSVTLGAKIGVAEIPRTPNTAWTLIAWTDTRNVLPPYGSPLNMDVYSTVLLHGTTTPVGTDSSATVQRNVPTSVPIGASDADADPLTYSIAQDGTLGHAVIPDPNQPVLSYTGTQLGADLVRVAISDGLHSSTATITLQVANTPPQIACPALSTPIDTPLPIPATCVSDKNNDPVSLDASAPQHGTIQRTAGVLTFIPAKGFQGIAQVTLIASDGIDTATQTVNIQVGTPGQIPVAFVGGDQARAAFTDRPITLSAMPTVAGADPGKIIWSFNGTTITDQGKTVAHLFASVGKYSVSARIGGGPPSIVRVFVSKPPLTIKSTDLRNGVMRLRVQLSAPGKLAVSLLGVRGTHRTFKRKPGTYTLHMRLPASARKRGTVIMKLSLAGATPRTVKRAVLLPAP
jgi:hypothetical protein